MRSATEISIQTTVVKLIYIIEMKIIFYAFINKNYCKSLYCTLTVKKKKYQPENKVYVTVFVKLNSNRIDYLIEIFTALYFVIAKVSVRLDTQ